MKMGEKRGGEWAIIFCFCVLAASCSSPKEKKAVALYKIHCANCHLLPSIEDLPKAIWKNGVLPDMAARMGIVDSTYNPYKGRSFDEQYAMKQTGIYFVKPQLSLQDWALLKNYILSMAPDSLSLNAETTNHQELTQFSPRPLKIDSVAGSYITFLDYDEKTGDIVTADLKGNLRRNSLGKAENQRIERTGEVITAYSEKNGTKYITHTGYLNPSEIASGNIQTKSNDSLSKIPILLHRPVHTLVYDFDKDGQEELVVSEFGDLTGCLSLLYKGKDQAYQKKVLSNRPGAVRTVAKDMNGDGKDDIIVLIAQGQESIIILYQEDNLEFKADPVIKFSPVYGSSWFELIDFNGDGYDDIITVNGDNADQSYVQKPYHGLRIHINNGKNQFEEKFFYSMNGATRLVARDFDQDGDVDFGVLSTFPDYERKPEFSFVHLENKCPESFEFKASTFQDARLGRWFLIDAGDVDNDGDDDIILSAFSYGFTPVPKNVSDLWESSDLDLMILENNTIRPME